jgi:hypothetical protein
VLNVETLCFLVDTVKKREEGDFNFPPPLTKIKGAQAPINGQDSFWPSSLFGRS